MRLQWVNVSGEGLEILLGSSPLLEELSPSHCERPTAFKIIGPSLALKRLEIVNCYLASVEIRDVNLEFLMYHGEMLQQFVLKNVPLVEMHLGGSILGQMKYFLLMFSSYLPHLKKLTIDSFSMSFYNEEEGRMFYNNVKMSNLHHLIFKYEGVCEFMPPVTYFIRAAPLLQSFVLEVYGGSKREESFYFGDNFYKILGCYKYPHLERVEFIGYRGRSSELGLAMHLLKNRSALKQFIIDLRKRDNPQIKPNCINGWLPVGYPYKEEHKINALKVRVEEEITRRLPKTIQRLHFNIL